VVRPNLVVGPDDDICAGQVIKGVANVGELLNTPAILDASHLQDHRDGGLVDGLENPCGYEPGIRDELAEHLLEPSHRRGVLCRLDIPDVYHDGTLIY
jgi:hypothetical protein